MWMIALCVSGCVGVCAGVWGKEGAGRAGCSFCCLVLADQQSAMHNIVHAHMHNLPTITHPPAGGGAGDGC
jgi:hypothetical protein